MKKTFISCFLGVFFTSFAYTQNVDHFEGGHFVKRIEYNLVNKGEGRLNDSIIFGDNYNINSKGDLEKLFFGDINAAIEFYYLPSSEAAFKRPPYGFHVTKDKSNTYSVIEIKHVSNYKEASKEASSKYPPIGVLNPFTISDERRDQIREHNRDAFAKQYEEMLKLFKVETLTFPVSDWFVENLHEKTVSFINNFKAKGVPPMMLDGYSVTFRTVVDDEVWSLWIHIPQGNALKMTDFFLQIIKDAEQGVFDEERYISVLDML